MKRAMLVVFSLLMTPSLFADAGSRLIPAGALVSCTTGDGKISSKTTAVGDPILCKVQFHRGDFMMPYNSYLGGEFAEYKDPGHFVGKGWMELDFDRLYVGDQVIPISAKVVDAPGYKIDAQGRILGRGHAVRDTVMWMIPVLWPIDLINLPRRGPRPTLKSETALTLRVMDDIQVPVVPEPQRDPYGLYQRGPQSYAPQPAPPTQAPDAGPEQSYAPEPPAPEEQPAAPQMAYAPPVPYAVPYVPPVVTPYYPSVIPYVGVTIGPRVGAYAYRPRPYVGGPAYRGYGYAPRAYAPAVRSYGYGYGYAAHGYVGGGYAARGYSSAGFSARGTMMASRGGMGFRGGARGR
ncbi:MAG TPA: hypothetical protein VGG45_01125 [Terracidiphilus sp.]|jgi:hypothetical protein